MTTDVNEFFTDLDAGVFEQKLSKVLSDVAAAVVEHGRKGELTIKLDMSQIGNSNQVMIKSKMSFARPTTRGTAKEDETTQTPMFIGKKGLSMLPENQGQMFDKRGQVTTNNQ
jgi:hypothetical protein